MRRLPPTFTEDDLKNAVDPIPDYNYFKFVAGDKEFGQNSFSRAYINFIDSEEIFNFRDKFDGYVFIDQKGNKWSIKFGHISIIGEIFAGNEFPAQVEYAPFQKIPKLNPTKKDARSGTIDEDQDYLQFLKNLENPETVSLTSIETLLEEYENADRELKGKLWKKTSYIFFLFNLSIHS